MWLLSYWVLPLISAGMWLGMIAAMFGRWEATGHPIYPSEDDGQTIAYISDVGAFKLKPLFITGCTITVVFLDLAFLSERWLRHTGKLARNTHTSQKILSVCSIFCAIAGSAGLILLSIFDTYHHPHLHDGLLCLFIVGYLLSAVFLCAEYQRLGIHYRNHRVLRFSFWIKLIFILVELAFAIVFVGTGWTHNKNIAAVFEWIIAVVFTFYILSFVIDLLPSVQTKHHIPQGMQDVEPGHPYGLHHVGSGGQPLTGDSTGPHANGDVEKERAPAPIGTNF